MFIFFPFFPFLFFNFTIPFISYFSISLFVSVCVLFCLLVSFYFPFFSFFLFLSVSLSPSLYCFFFLRGLPCPLAIQASDSTVTAAAQAINTVCLVSFLADCIKHWMAVADYSWDSSLYTCWVGEIQVNSGTLAAAQWEGQESGQFECFHVTLDERCWKMVDVRSTSVMNIREVHQPVSERLIYCVSQGRGLNKGSYFTVCCKT